jgi:hypothetical protein
MLTERRSGLLADIIQRGRHIRDRSLVKLGQHGLRLFVDSDRHGLCGETLVGDPVT